MQREVNMGHPFESRRHIDSYHNNNFSRLRLPSDLDCCFMAILSWRKPSGPRIMRKLWSNSRVRTQGNDKRQNPKSIEVLLRETARNICVDPENVDNLIIAPRPFVSTTRLFFFCVTVMFQNQADGYCADRANGTIGAARRRRNRRLRAFLKHELMTVATNLATVQHHSFMKSTVVEVGVQMWSHLRFDYDLSSAEKSDGASDETSSMIEYVPPTPDVTYTELDPVIEHATLALVDVCTTPAPVIELMPAPVIEYIAPSPAVSYPSCGQINEAITGLVNPQFSITADETSQMPVVVQESPEVQFVESVPEQTVEPVEMPLLQEPVHLHTAFQIVQIPVLKFSRSLKIIFLSGLWSKSCLNRLRSKSGTFLFLRSSKRQSIWFLFYLMSIFYLRWSTSRLRLQ